MNTNTLTKNIYLDSSVNNTEVNCFSFWQYSCLKKELYWIEYDFFILAFNILLSLGDKIACKN